MRLRTRMCMSLDGYVTIRGGSVELVYDLRGWTPVDRVPAARG